MNFGETDNHHETRKKGFSKGFVKVVLRYFVCNTKAKIVDEKNVFGKVFAYFFSL